MKTIKVFYLFILLVLVTGCNKEKYMTCTIDIKNSEQNYNLQATYKIFYKDNYVTKINKNEIYNSGDEDIIDYFEEYKNLDYKNKNDLYGGFEYHIDSDNESLELNVIIDLNNVNIDKMINDDILDKDYTINNRLTITGIKYFYSAKGANCDI